MRFLKKFNVRKTTIRIPIYKLIFYRISPTNGSFIQFIEDKYLLRVILDFLTTFKFATHLLIWSHDRRFYLVLRSNVTAYQYVFVETKSAKVTIRVDNKFS